MFHILAIGGATPYSWGAHMTSWQPQAQCIPKIIRSVLIFWINPNTLKTQFNSHASLVLKLCCLQTFLSNKGTIFSDLIKTRAQPSYLMRYFKKFILNNYHFFRHKILGPKYYDPGQSRKFYWSADRTIDPYSKLNLMPKYVRWTC